MKKAAFFITGTGTGVGKTYVTAALAASLVNIGVSVGVMKPVESGCRKKDGVLPGRDAVLLKKASATSAAMDDVSPFRFSRPLAPSVASRIEGVAVDFKKIKDSFTRIRRAHGITLVEGAGGLFTPLTDDRTNADLALYLRLPVIIVAASRLGAINETLQTVIAARASGLTVWAVILNQTEDGAADESVRYNKTEIERFLTGLPVIFEFDYRRRRSGFCGAPPDELLQTLFGVNRNR